MRIDIARESDSPHVCLHACLLTGLSASVECNMYSLVRRGLLGIEVLDQGGVGIEI